MVRFGSVFRKKLTLFSLLLLCGNALADTSPWQLIAHTHSDSSASLSWRMPLDTNQWAGFRVFRDDIEIGTTQSTVFVDQALTPNTGYRYYVTAILQDGSESAPSNADEIRTLINGDNDGLRNGSAPTGGGNARLRDFCGVNRVDRVSNESLDTCLKSLLDANALPQHVEDIRAFVARLRREEDRDLIALGQRLFHSKALSQNTDTSCSSCHHPTLGCGGDGLSLPIGVNAVAPEILGPGRSDGNALPTVPRHSQAVCNVGLWQQGVFWDRRISMRDDATVRTEERAVTREVNNSSNPSLLMAQAYFPLTAAAEMGDPSGFETPQDYREHLVGNLSDAWQPLFEDAFGSESISMENVARAIAAYEKSALFIDNAFFDYVEGDLSELSDVQKRGALVFYTYGTCNNCHRGALFSPETNRPPAFPQIGTGTGDNGADIARYRVPSLLNIALTAPYGHAGQFETLERVIAHYMDIHQSINGYFDTGEVCQLSQFAYLGDTCQEVLAPNGLANSLEALELGGFANLVTALDEDEVSWLVAFLHSLTDESAMAGSPEIRALTPDRDGGPDGLQLDATDKDGNPL